MRRGHRGDGHRAQDSRTFINSSGKNHLAINGKIVSRRKQTGVARNSTHAKGRRVMHLSAQPLLAFGSGILAAVAEIIHLATPFFCWRNAAS